MPSRKPARSESKAVPQLGSDDLLLRRLVRWRTTPEPFSVNLGELAVEQFNREIRKRHDKFGKLAEAWNTLVPELFAEHCYLVTFVRGTLTVNVDSSAHLFELKQLLLAGLEDQILLACRPAGLKKIVLKRGKADGG